jgi:protein unc-13
MSIFCSFNRRVDVSVMAMGKLLYEVKGGGQGQAISKSEIQAAADAILQPLMDLLDGILFYYCIIFYNINCGLYFIYFKGSLSMYAQICDKSVLKRLLKELWKIVIRSLERSIVLPPVTDRSVTLSNSNKSKINKAIKNLFLGFLNILIFLIDS